MKRAVDFEGVSPDAPGPPGSVIGPSSSRRVLLDVARSHVNQVVFVVSVGFITFAYTMLLTFAYTQRLSWENWHYLYARIVIWSIALALAMASVIVLQVHALVRVSQTRSRTATRAVGVVGFVSSVLPSLLCCTPVIPSALAFVGLSGVSVYGTTGTLQHFFATYQTEFLVASLALLIATAWWSVRRMSSAVCFTDDVDGACGSGLIEKTRDIESKEAGRKK